jgi:transposase
MATSPSHASTTPAVPSPSTRQSSSVSVSKTRKRFTEEEKRNAVRLVDELKYSFAAAAKASGCSEPALYGWHARFGIRPEPCGANASYEELKAELKRTKEQLHRAEMEREILKKATAYFAAQKP